jgi:hypothetical protein
VLKLVFIQAMFLWSALANAGELKLFFDEGQPFDGQCQALKQDENYKITSAMQTELHERLPEFERLWNTQGKALLMTMADLFKHPFGREEVTLTTTLCQWFSPMSSPLILRMREYLRATAKDNPKGPQELKPDSYFVGQVFHELIHQYLDRYFGKIDEPQNSTLSKKHASEPGGVLIHLHHLSIQKAVYLKLNRQKELETIITLDSQIRGGIYKRAWEIVNEDGYQKYIDELGKFKPQK